MRTRGASSLLEKLYHRCGLANCGESVSKIPRPNFGLDCLAHALPPYAQVRHLESACFANDSGHEGLRTPQTALECVVLANELTARHGILIIEHQLLSTHFSQDNKQSI
jgi:hypothetical protein